MTPRTPRPWPPRAPSTLPTESAHTPSDAKAPKSSTEVAPTLAPEDTPSRNGSARALRTKACTTVPAVVSAAPTTAASSTRGRRICHTISSATVTVLGRPVRWLTTTCHTARGLKPTDPTATPIVMATIRSSAHPLSTIENGRRPRRGARRHFDCPAVAGGVSVTTAAGGAFSKARCGGDGICGSPRRNRHPPPEGEATCGRVRIVRRSPSPEGAINVTMAFLPGRPIAPVIPSDVAVVVIAASSSSIGELADSVSLAGHRTHHPLLRGPVTSTSQPGDRTHPHHGA